MKTTNQICMGEKKKHFSALKKMNVFYFTYAKTESYFRHSLGEDINIHN